MIVSSHLVFEVTVICIPPEVNSDGIHIKCLGLSVSLTFYPQTFNPRVDKKRSFAIDIFLLQINISSLSREQLTYLEFLVSPRLQFCRSWAYCFPRPDSPFSTCDTFHDRYSLTTFWKSSSVGTVSIF